MINNNILTGEIEFGSDLTVGCTLCKQLSNVSDMFCLVSTNSNDSFLQLELDILSTDLTFCIKIFRMILSIYTFFIKQQIIHVYFKI